MKKLLILFACLLSMNAMRTTEAASFDCKKAKTEIEKTICTNAVLSKLDEEMATHFMRAQTMERKLGQMPNKSAQRDWMLERNKCNVDEQCLRRAYDERIGELQGLTGLVLGKYEIAKNIDSIYTSFTDESICNVFLNDLNSFRNGSPAMACKAFTSPHATSFKRPNWRKWSSAEMWERRDVLFQIEAIITTEKEHLSKQKFFADLRVKLSKKVDGPYGSVSEARIDLFNSPARYLRYERSACDPAVAMKNQPEGVIFIQLSLDGKRVMGVDSLFGASQMLYRRPDLVLRKGKIFHQVWGEASDLSLLDALGTSCHFRFIENNGSQEK